MTTATENKISTRFYHKMIALLLFIQLLDMALIYGVIYMLYLPGTPGPLETQRQAAKMHDFKCPKAMSESRQCCQQYEPVTHVCKRFPQWNVLSGVIAIAQSAKATGKPLVMKKPIIPDPQQSLPPIYRSLPSVRPSLLQARHSNLPTPAPLQ